MRKFVGAFFLLTLMLGGISMTAYATDCTKDTPANRFGDWFATVGKKEKKKDRILASRKANRLAECAEKKGQAASGTV